MKDTWKQMVKKTFLKKDHQLKLIRDWAIYSNPPAVQIVTCKTFLIILKQQQKDGLPLQTKLEA